jgi:hypothetical protein
MKVNNFSTMADSVFPKKILGVDIFYWVIGRISLLVDNKDTLIHTNKSITESRDNIGQNN